MSSRLSAVLLLLIVVATACGGGSGKQTATSTKPSPSGPTASGTPVYHGSLKTGAWVRVVGADGCLNMQWGTGSNSPVANFCEPNGYEGYLADGPVFGDGYWWWWLAGQGWARDEYLQFVRSEDLSKRTVPELKGLGQIAYVGADGGIWLMNSDGSGRKRLVKAPPASAETYNGLPQWRPDGKELLYVSVSYGIGTAAYEVRIIDLDGSLVKAIPNATSAFWSPDGAQLGVLSNVVKREEADLRATSAVVDLVTGAVKPIGPEQLYIEGPKWRPAHDELSYLNDQGAQLVNADGSGTHRLLLPELAAYRVVNWSPDGRRVSMQVYSDACQGYAVFDIDTSSQTACASAPEGDTRRLGRGGTAEDGQTNWSLNGKFFAYHTEWAVVNKSGVYVVDASSGSETLLPGWAPEFTSFAPDSQHVVFGTYGSNHNVIWVGDATTGEVFLLADGSQPAWRPVIN